MNEQPSDIPVASKRLTSLDAFRGLTIAGMILVNNPGSWENAYRPLGHADWHGWTPTDLVFPSFLFIVGVAIPLALGKRIARGDSAGALIGKIVIRSVLIFAIGLFMNGYPLFKGLAELRIPGVLQRIALCYLAASLLFITTRVRTQVFITFALLLGYWAAMTLIPVPGVGAGDLTRPNNLAAWVDRALFPGHTYKPDYDPEGLLSTLPAIATTLIGVFAGCWLQTARPISERTCGIFAAGTMLFSLGSAWAAWFPINKALWTSSFTLFCAGLSLQILGICIWLIEVEGVKRWAWPFLVFGTNALAAYILSGLGARFLPLWKVAATDGTPMPIKTFYMERLLGWADPAFASLLFALTYVGFWFLIMAILYRLKIFIRV